MQRRNLSLSASIAFCLAIGLIFVASSNADNTSKKVAAKKVTFSKDVAPIFSLKIAPSVTGRARARRFRY